MRKPSLTTFTPKTNPAITQEGTNIILLAPDLMDTFPDSDSVNEALRSLKAIATRATHRA